MARKKARPAQIKIRLPETLRRNLEREAAKTGRTLNGEIVYRLTQPFEQADRGAIATAAATKLLYSIQAVNPMLRLHPELSEEAQRKRDEEWAEERRKIWPPEVILKAEQLVKDGAETDMDVAIGRVVNEIAKDKGDKT